MLRIYQIIFILQGLKENIWPKLRLLYIDTVSNIVSPTENNLDAVKEYSTMVIFKDELTHTKFLCFCCLCRNMYICFLGSEESVVSKNVGNMMKS